MTVTVTTTIRIDGGDGQETVKLAQDGRSAVDPTDVSARPAQDAPGTPETPSSNPGCTPGRDLADAKALLDELAVEQADYLLRTYREDRIVAVCKRALQRGDKLRNPPGWVRMALQRGWRV